MNGEKQHPFISGLKEKSKRIKDPAGQDIRIIEDDQAMGIASETGCHPREVFLAALRNRIYPYRYIRNRKIVSRDEQIRLAESRAAVIGCGGLGGQVILLLARLGLGHLVVLDRDVFDETNLNRQALSSRPSIGKSKAKTAADMVCAVNPGVEVTPHLSDLTSRNAEDILEGCHVAVDALDNVAGRFVLEKAAKKRRIPLVHGAIAGFEGQIMTIFPGDPGLALIYGPDRSDKDRSRRAEARLGVPGLTAAFVANLEAMEVFKILLGRGKPFRHTLVHVDLETGQMESFAFGDPHPTGP